MPYNISGETPSITVKMERCVKEVLARGVKPIKGRDKKSSAIAICKSQIMKSRAISKKLKE